MTQSSPKLVFKKSIISTPKENIPLKELQSRLDTLATELSKVDAENFRSKSLDKYKEDLVNKKLLTHKDLGVQSLVACCLSDILRIYAPDAPFTDTQLFDIFKLFIKQFQRLADIENPYYTQQVYLLTRSAEVRSIILVTDITNSTQLIESIFELFYNSSNVFHKKLEPIISDILIEIISEWDHITNKVLNLILNKFLVQDKKNSVSSSLSTSNASSFNFSLNICNANPDRLARYLTKYFSEVLFESNSGEDEDSEVSVKNLTKIHKLSVQIWKNVPEILGSVMGLIDNELNADDYKIRIVATETVGKILSINSRVNFIQVHKQTWINWMKKTLDISPFVRSKWVEQSADILLNRNDINQEIFNGLSKSLIDADERVRLTTIRTILNLPPAVLLEKLNGESGSDILDSIVKLTREKHLEIREEAIKILGDLFHVSYNSLVSTDQTDYDTQLKAIKDIPSHILNLYYINDKNINYLVDVTLLEKILPFNDNEIERAKRLIFVFGNLDSKAKASFLAFNKRQQQLANVLQKLIEFSESYNGGNTSNDELKQKIDKTINWLTVTIPDSFVPADVLKRFVDANNRRLYYLLKIITADDSDYKSLRNSSKEFLTRVQDPKTFNNVKDKANVPFKNLANTFKILIYRSSQTIFNRSNISILLKLNQSDDPHIIKISQELIDDVSTISPSSFQNQISDLVNIIKNSTPGDDSNSQSNTLKAIFRIFRKLRNLLDETDYKFFDKIIEFGEKGLASEARYAVKIISLSEKKDVFFIKLFGAIYPLSQDNDHLPAHLAAISQIFLSAPYIVEENINDITPFLIKNVLLTNEIAGTDDDPAWIEDEELESEESASLVSKIYAIKIFTNSLRAFSDSDSDTEETTKQVAENVLKLLSSFVGNGGEIVSSKSENYPTPKHHQSRLRLEAGLSILKLARFAKYNKMISSQLLERLVLLIQDENAEARSRFIHKLTTYLKNQEISLRFLPLVYTIAYEPLDSLKSDIKTWIKSSFHKITTSSKKGAQGKGRNDIVFEKSLTGLIYLISHHSEFLDYINATEDLEENQLKAYTFSLEYISFFLDSVANEQNISLLYYLASRVKQYRDASFDDKEFENKSDSVNHIYRVADLAQLAIKELQDTKGWVLSTYPGKIELSSDLFKPTKSVSETQSTLSRNFIDAEVLKKLRLIIKMKIASITTIKRSRPQNNESISALPKPKRTKISESTKFKKQYKRRAADDGDDEADGTFKGANVKNTEIDQPLRKSSRSKRVSYAQENEANNDEDREDDDDEEEEEEESDNES